MNYCLLWGLETGSGITPRMDESNSLDDILWLAELVGGTVLDSKDRIVADFSAEGEHDSMLELRATSERIAKRRFA